VSTEVPNRGDGFDSGASSGQPVSGYNPASMRNLDFSKLDIKQIMSLVSVDEKGARILKDLAVGAPAGIGAAALRELNDAMGGLVGEEWAGAIGGGLGGFLGGLLSKQIKKPIGRRKSR
jgi:hypothetical protein